MKIQSRAMILLVFSLIVSVTIFTGCTGVTSKSGQTNVPQGKGVSDVTPRDSLKNISLESSIEALDGTVIPGSNVTDRLFIYYIRGGSVDFSGLAKNWAIGGQKGTASFFFIQDSSSIQLINWTSALPDQEIDLTKVMRPEELLTQRRLLIQDMTSGGKVPITELELQDGQYIVTVQYGSELQIRRFNAITGESIV